MLMMLDIAHALSLILERSGRRTEFSIPTMLALLFARRSLWCRRDSYRNWMSFNRNGRNHGVGRGVDDRDGARPRNIIDVAFIGHVGSGSVGRDGHRNSKNANRSGRNDGVGRGVDVRDILDRSGG